MADDLIDKYLGGNSVLSAHTGSEFLEGLVRAAESGSRVPKNLVKRIVQAYRSCQDFR